MYDIANVRGLPQKRHPEKELFPLSRHLTPFTALNTVGMAGLDYLNALMTMSGNRFSRKLFGVHHLGDLLNWIMRIMITASTIYTIFGAHQFTHEATIIGSIQDLCSVTASLSIIFVVAIRRKRIKLLVRQLLMHGLPESLERTSRYYLIVSVILIIAKTVIQPLSMFGRITLPEAVLIVLTELPANLHQFMVRYSMCYIIMIKLLSHSELLTLHKLRLDLNHSGMNLVKHIRIIRSLSVVREEFESLFSAIPFILFATCFMKIPAAVVDVKCNGTNEGTMTLLTFIAYYIVDDVVAYGFIMYLVYVVCRVNDDVRRSIKQLIDLIRDKHFLHMYTNGAQIMIESLKEYQEFSFTGAHLFQINSDLILAFLSSIITFSVLMIQLDTNDG